MYFYIVFVIFKGGKLFHYFSKPDKGIAKKNLTLPLKLSKFTLNFFPFVSNLSRFSLNTKPLSQSLDPNLKISLLFSSLLSPSSSFLYGHLIPTFHQICSLCSAPNRLRSFLRDGIVGSALINYHFSVLI